MGKKSHNSKPSKKLLPIGVIFVLIIALLISRAIINNDGSNTPGLSGQGTSQVAVTETPNVVSNDTDNSYTDSKLEIYFFDVGQADSILLMTDDKVMLVDTGNAGDADTSFKIGKKINLSHELNRLGIKKIDYLIATHPHEDHMGSMYKILKMFDVKELYANKILPEEEWTSYYRRFVTALEESNTHLVTPTTLSDEELKAKVDEYNNSVSSPDEKVVFNPNDYFRVGDTIPFGNAKVTILGPNSEKYSDTNDYSIVLMVEFEGRKILLSGDAGKTAEKEILNYTSGTGFDLKADILKVGHHGSRTASTEDFISKVKPSVAIIMAERGNSYGLPDEDVIERLERHGATVFQIMDLGDIKVTIDDGKIDIDVDFSHEEKKAM